jgi:hypothetical protein
MSDYTGMSDKADEVYANGAMLSIEGIPGIEGILGDEPFLVIGDYAYILGYDGSVYMAPYNSDVWVGATRRSASYKTVKWEDAVEITNSDRMDFPSNRLASLLSDLGNIRDILRQHGVKVETDK